LGHPPEEDSDASQKYKQTESPEIQSGKNVLTEMCQHKNSRSMCEEGSMLYYITFSDDFDKCSAKNGNDLENHRHDFFLDRFHRIF
jgi:hypothetical protein